MCRNIEKYSQGNLKSKIKHNETEKIDLKWSIQCLVLDQKVLERENVEEGRWN